MSMRVALNFEGRWWEIWLLLLVLCCENLTSGCKRRNLTVNVGKSKVIIFESNTDTECRGNE